MSEQMPAAFIGHGNPMNTIEHNRYTDAWRDFGATAPTPKAILAISAHWFVNITAVTAMARPRTIHDFYGFPQELFDVDYPAAGDPVLAEHITEVVKPTYVGQDADSWGLDHGTWSVLAHMYPLADVPVIQLSINAQLPYEYHHDLGASLAPLRQEGVLIVASGNVVHNLGLIDWSKPGQGEPWAHVFDDAVRATMTSDPDSLAGVLDLPEARAAVPTADHFLPLAYIAGLAAASSQTASTLLDGYDMGSLSMTAYELAAID